MGKKCVDLVKIALFLLLLICFVSLLDRILANGTDNHKYLFRDFYDAPADEVDVVYMGPSSAGWSWNPAVAYHENGVGSQLLTSERLPADAFPYLLKEAALKRPKLYIIDAEQLLGSLSGDFAAVQSVLINLRRSANRQDAASDMLENYSKEEQQVRYLPLLYFHNRWKEVSRRDFEPVDYDFMGFSLRSVQGSEMPQGREQLEAPPQELSKEHVENLEEVLRVCGQLDGKVLFMIAPNDGGSAGAYSSIRGRVEAAGFDYLNASAYLEEIGMEPGDFEGGRHLTAYGAEKYTTWLSGWITQTYGLKDRRAEAGYQEAQRYEETYQAYQKEKIGRGVMFGKYLETILNPRYSVLLAVRDEASQGLGEEILQKLRQFGLEQTPAGRYRASYYAVVDQGNLLLEQATEAESNEMLHASGTLADGTPFILQSAGWNAGNYASMIVNGIEYAVNARGINIVVYDNLTKEVIDSVAFDTCVPELTAVRGIPKQEELEVDLSALSEPKEEGTAWNAPGNLMIPEGHFLNIHVPDSRSAKALQVFLDADDRYQIQFCIQEKIHTVYTVSQDTEKKGLREVSLDLSADGVMEFDSIRIVPVQRNGGCSVGCLSMQI